MRFNLPFTLLLSFPSQLGTILFKWKQNLFSGGKTTHTCCFVQFLVLFPHAFCSDVSIFQDYISSVHRDKKSAPCVQSFVLRLLSVVFFLSTGESRQTQVHEHELHQGLRENVRPQLRCQTQGKAGRVLGQEKEMETRFFFNSHCPFSLISARQN